MSEPAFEVGRVDPKQGPSRLLFKGQVTFPDAAVLWRQVRELLDPPASIEFDLSAVERIDTGSLALLLQLREEVRQRGDQAEIVGVQGRARDMLDLLAKQPQAPLRDPARKVGILDQVGTTTLSLLDEAKGVLTYLGEIIVSVGKALRAPRTVHWPDLGRLMERVGADGLPIVGMISFLIGFIMAFQAAAQLKQFGADIFVADLVGLVVVRELGPLMTAIIVAGRTGAAYAAELGTMKVSEEIDALRTLSLDPFRFLVFPRALALVIMLPLLTLLADLIALSGGLMVGVFFLNLTPSAYINESQSAMGLWDVFSGVLKSGVFGLAIALIACQRGLATRGGAEGVGRSTTSAVVSIMFSLVALDAGFTILFYLYGV
jgi:phospholipid/cholesterol/gamma-HCH transport system permease protein